MEQLSMFDSRFTTDDMLAVLTEIYLSEDKTEMELASRGTSSYDTIYFKGKPLDFRVKSTNKGTFLFVRSYWKNKLTEMNKTYIEEKSEPWLKLNINASSVYEYKDLFLAIYDKRVQERIADGFDCCSLYMQCSDAKQCVNQNKAVYSNCNYRHLLRRGIIFHGKNRTLPD